MAEKPRVHESWEALLQRHEAEVLQKGQEEEAGREALHAAVRERIAKARETGAPPAVKPPVPVPQETHHPREQELKVLEAPRQVAFLAQLALDEGVEPAVRLAERIGSPYVMDALHDLLVDRLLNILAERKSAPPS